jgi:hypothetical protein
MRKPGAKRLSDLSRIRERQRQCAAVRDVLAEYRISVPFEDGPALLDAIVDAVMREQQAAVLRELNVASE